MQLDKLTLQYQADLYFKTDTLKILNNLKEFTVELKENKLQLKSNKKEYEVLFIFLNLVNS